MYEGCGHRSAVEQMVAIDNMNPPSHHHLFAAAAAAAAAHSHTQEAALDLPHSCSQLLLGDADAFLTTKFEMEQTWPINRGAPDQHSSSQCRRGTPTKRAKIQQFSPKVSTLKVRKEKLGDRITALHQLVCPFGKTDTASVLLEAIGYIKFLENQVEALSLPYLCPSGCIRQPHSGKKNYMLPDDHGKEFDEEPKDLRSRGLCLVPISCTLEVGSENAADYWAPAFGPNFQ